MNENNYGSEQRTNLQNDGFNSYNTYGQNDNYSYSQQNSGYSQRGSRTKSLIEKFDENIIMISRIGKIVIFGYFIITMIFGVMKTSNETGNLNSTAFTFIIPKLAAMGMMYAGWTALVDYKKKLLKQRDKCTDTVLAVLVDYKIVEHHSEEGGTTYSYYAIYNYTYNDVTYRTKSDMEYYFSSFQAHKETGFECKLLVNPKNPMEIYEVDQEYIRVKRQRLFGIVTFCFLTFAALLIEKSLLSF